jgi:hypothetical protein
MRRRNIVLAVLAGVLLTALAVFYHIRYGGHSQFMSGFLSLRQAARSTPDRLGGEGVPPKPLPLVEKYVDKAAPGVALLLETPQYRMAPLEIRRMKLMEFFTLKVADPDYMLLSDADKKRVLDIFLERYLVP